MLLAYKNGISFQVERGPVHKQTLKAAMRLSLDNLGMYENMIDKL